MHNLILFSEQFQLVFCKPLLPRLHRYSRDALIQCCGSETIISNPDPDLDPTWRVISDPDPVLGSFRIRIRILD